MVECFESLDVVPNMDTPEDLTDWMKDLTCGRERSHDDQGQTQSPDIKSNLHKPAVTTHFLPTPKILLVRMIT